MLYFKRQCADVHSGCKPEYDRKIEIVKKSLHNRQTSVQADPYEDNVNNKNDGICMIGFFHADSITRSCKTEGGRIVSGGCSYDFAQTQA